MTSATRTPASSAAADALRDIRIHAPYRSRTIAATNRQGEIPPRLSAGPDGRLHCWAVTLNLRPPTSCPPRITVTVTSHVPGIVTLPLPLY